MEYEYGKRVKIVKTGCNEFDGVVGTCVRGNTFLDDDIIVLLDQPRELHSGFGQALTVSMFYLEEISEEHKLEEAVTISKERYDEMYEAENKLYYLEAMGVDNWSGYGDAMDMFNGEED